MFETDYDVFEKQLSNSAWEDKIRICIRGIFNNVFFRGAKFISDLNMETLRERFPEVYETVKDNNVRRALIISEMFKATIETTILRKLGVEELEIEIDGTHPSTGFHGWNFLTLIRQRDFTQAENLYGGKDAVKIFFKSIFFISKELYSVLNSPVLRDVWRARSGLEFKRDKLREIIFSELQDIAQNIPNEAKCFTDLKKAVNTLVYFLYYWYVSVGKKVKRKLERLLDIKL